LRSIRSKKRLAAETRRETNFLSNEPREKWIEDSVERQTAVARTRVQDAQTAMKQEQENMVNVHKGQSTTTMSEISFQEMLNAIADSLSDLPSSEDEEDGEDMDDDEEDTCHGKLSDDDEPGLLMGTMSKTVQDSIKSFRQKQLRHDELTHPGWVDAADYFRERDMKYRPTELKVPAVGNPQADLTAATPSPTTCGELMQTLEIIPRQSQMPQVCLDRELVK
jgi:hypothetical protein